MRGHGDLRLTAWGALACALAALLLPWQVVSLVFAAPLALVVPGYAIVAAAFARREIGPVQTAVLSVALSLATLALGGLVLNYLGGIHSLTWAILLLLVAIGCSRLAALRRSAPPARLRLRLPRPNGLQLGLGLTAAVATVVALVLSTATLPASRALGFTELWIVPVPGSSGSEAQVGIKNQEQQATEYDLGVRIGKQLVRRSFELQSGEAKFVRIGPPVAPAGSTVPVVVTLLLDEDPTRVYRRVKASLVAPGATQ